SVTTVNEAFEDGVFESNLDNAMYKYSGDVPNDYPVYDELVLSGRNDYVAASTIVELMNNLKDPRRAVYFDPNIQNKIGMISDVRELSESKLLVNFDSTIESPLIKGNNVYEESESETPILIGTIDDFTSRSIVINQVQNQPKVGD